MSAIELLRKISDTLHAEATIYREIAEKLTNLSLAISDRADCLDGLIKLLDKGGD